MQTGAVDFDSRREDSLVRTALLGLAFFRPQDFVILNRIFGEGPDVHISDGPSESPSKFERLVLGCIDTDLLQINTRWLSS